jgi:hypothetical protein
MNDRIATAERIADLLARFVVKSLKPKEAEELKAWVSENEDNNQEFQRLTDVKFLELEQKRRSIV